MIYVFFAEGFEEIEALAPVDVLRRGGIEVKTVGVTGKTVTGAHGIAVSTDMTVDQITLEGLEGIVLPGGMPGTLNLEANERLCELVRQADRKQLLIGAICAAPSVLGHLGVLNGKRATCFPGFEKELAGATVCDEQVVCDGNIITAKGAGAALDFAFALLCFLTDKQTADDMSKAMCCK
ncbi:MAG: DJ-1/PfpI family protein [Clostridia bacterium]|nr:DJ-1/PfpI family protein [Clostridia bacterium]